jgi:hypothetical protein
MESEFAFDRRGGVLKVSIRGVVDATGLVTLGNRTGEANTKEQPKSIVYDFSGVTKVDLPTTAVEFLAHLRPVIGREIKQVIVAPQDFLFGLGRMFQAMAAETRPSVYVVRSWPEALKLLGLSKPPEFESLKN